MAQFDLKKQALVGAGGLLSVREDDEITRKLSMLVEGECEGLGPTVSRKACTLDSKRLNSSTRTRPRRFDPTRCRLAYTSIQECARRFFRSPPKVFGLFRELGG